MVSGAEPVPAHPDWAGAVAYALERLGRELAPALIYHSVAHTADDVLPAVRRLARLAGVTGEEQALLEVAAAFHDLGYIRTFAGHEAISVEIMAEALPAFGFDPAAIQRLSGLVMTTRMPQAPHDGLERLLADADLDVLGREDFLATSTALWREQAELGKPVAWSDWLRSQLNFLRGHRYFTPEARTLRDAGKAANVLLLEELIRSGAGPA